MQALVARSYGSLVVITTTIRSIAVRCGRFRFEVELVLGRRVDAAHGRDHDTAGSLGPALHGSGKGSVQTLLLHPGRLLVGAKHQKRGSLYGLRTGHPHDGGAEPFAGGAQGRAGVWLLGFGNHGALLGLAQAGLLADLEDLLVPDLAHQVDLALGVEHGR